MYAASPKNWRIQHEVRRSRADLDTVPGLRLCRGLYRRGPTRGARNAALSRLLPVPMRADDLADFYANPPIQPHRFAGSF